MTGNDWLAVVILVVVLYVVRELMMERPDCLVCGAKNGEPCKVPPGRVCPWITEGKESHVNHRSPN
jgi:hypothetical protein